MLFNYITNIINKDVVLMSVFKFFKEPVKKENKLLILTKKIADFLSQHFTLHLTQPITSIT